MSTATQEGKQVGGALAALIRENALQDERPSTTVWKIAFLKALGSHGSPTQAARDAGVSLQRACSLRKRNGQFAKLWAKQKDLARRRMVDVAEKIVYRRGFQGWTEPIVSNGQVVAHKRKFSDTMAKTWLEANGPARYRRNRDSGGSGPNVTVNVQVQARMLADPEVLRRACELDALLASPAPPEAHHGPPRAIGSNASE